MSANPNKVFTTGNKAVNVTVKDPSEAYSTKRYKGQSTLRPTAKPVIEELLCVVSYARYQVSRAKAKAGVFFKHLANKSGIVNNPLREYEKALLTEMVMNDPWCGKVGSDYYDAIYHGPTIKAVIDDSAAAARKSCPLNLNKM